MERTIIELIVNKLKEVGIEVQPGIVLVTTDGDDQTGFGTPYIPNVKVKVGDFTIEGRAYLPEDFIQQLGPYFTKDKTPWPPHCLIGVPEQEGIEK